MWTYYAFRIAGFTLAYLPKRIGYAIAHFIADILFRLHPSLRAAVTDNMKHVLGTEADDAEVEAAARGVLRNSAKNYFDFIQLRRTDLGDIESHIDVNGWNNLEHSLEKGKGVILATAHLGSFDTAAQILAARSIKTTILVEPLEPPALLDHVTNLRSSNGIAFVPGHDGALKVLMQAVRRGETVLLACDRDIANNGLRSRFFGEEVTLPTIAVRLAMRTGAAIVPAFNLRRRNGRYDVYFEPAIDIIPAGDGAVAKNTDRIARVMEHYIRRSPTQWVVLSPFWASEHHCSGN